MTGVVVPVATETWLAVPDTLVTVPEVAGAEEIQFVPSEVSTLPLVPAVPVGNAAVLYAGDLPFAVNCETDPAVGIIYPMVLLRFVDYLN